MVFIFCLTGVRWAPPAGTGDINKVPEKLPELTKLASGQAEQEEEAGSRFRARLSPVR